MKELRKKIEYNFQNEALFKIALQHSSYANEHKSSGEESYERLEFLGDSILGFVVARHLYNTCPQMHEGQMTRMRAELVCEQSLYEVALRLGLGEELRLSKGEIMSGGRERQSILADCVEAIIAAIYLEGGLDKASEFIHKKILAGFDPQRDDGKSSDNKTELQELIQRTPGQTLSYEMIGSSGPDHQKIFSARVSLNGKAIGEGSGHTKKEAEQAAARSALKGLKK